MTDLPLVVRPDGSLQLTDMSGLNTSASISEHMEDLGRSKQMEDLGRSEHMKDLGRSIRSEFQEQSDLSDILTILKVTIRKDSKKRKQIVVILF